MGQPERARSRVRAPGVSGVSLLRRTELARRRLRAMACFTDDTMIFLAVILQSVIDLASDDPACRDSARRYLSGEYPFADHARSVGLDHAAVRSLLEQAELLPVCGCRVA